LEDQLQLKENEDARALEKVTWNSVVGCILTIRVFIVDSTNAADGGTTEICRKRKKLLQVPGYRSHGRP
jgi:hypothetical protein